MDTSQSIEVGEVYRIEMTEKDGITPKSGYDSKEKFFVVLGFDSLGNVYGGVVINSRINHNLSSDITDYYMPIRCSAYSFLKYDSFVNCTKLKTTTIGKLITGSKIGSINQEDCDLIVSTIIDSPHETKYNLKRFGLI